VATSKGQSKSVRQSSRVESPDTDTFTATYYQVYSKTTDTDIQIKPATTDTNTRDGGCN